MTLIFVIVAYGTSVTVQIRTDDLEDLLHDPVLKAPGVDYYVNIRRSLFKKFLSRYVSYC